MFMGEYQHTLDTKGRLIIPAKFRNQLGEKFIITRWLDRSLRGMPIELWHELEAQLNALPAGKSDARKFRALVFAGAMAAEFDKQGRILLPANLKGYANLTKDVAVTGNGDSFQIWNAQHWLEYQREAEANFDSIAEDLSDFDF